MQENIKQTLKQKFELYLNKCFEANIKYEAKSIEIIRQFEPDFQGKSSDFFKAHTIASADAYLEKQHYDINKKKYVDYDVIYENVGIVYDDIGKEIYKKIKRTKEYIEYKFYNEALSSISTILNIDYNEYYDENNLVNTKK